MGFDWEYDLEDAGIDAFDFSLMDDEERAEALRDACLDPDDFDGIEFDSSFGAWAALQDSGLSLRELDLMDEEEKRTKLEEAGLDPEDYDVLPRVYSSAYSSQAASAPPAQPPKVYRVYGVVFPGSTYSYAYLADGLNLAVGDIVIVPTGNENTPSAAKIVSVGDYTAETAPYPVEKTKSVLRRATAAESGPFLPKAAAPAVPSPMAKEEKPVSTPLPVSAPPPKGKKSGWWIAAAAVIVLVIIMGQEPKPSPAKSTSGTYRPTASASTAHSTYHSTTSAGNSYSSSRDTSSVPARPSVNRERAMTKEEAKKLSGTGYHGTRPNSSAEAAELKAAQVKCRNCGYHSHNGLNSLCDYCAWMKKYGGGLPTEKAPDITPKPAPTSSPRPTSKPASDPYNAGDYAYPDDFYDDHEDDFWDYEDAEDYWEKYN